MELCLGTVQLGMDYGIAGSKQPDLADAIKTLECAIETGIYAFDTAEVYGAAEYVLGEFISQNRDKGKKLQVFDKMDSRIFDQNNPELWKKEIEIHLDRTLQKLRLDHIHTYMFHNAKRVYNEILLEVLSEIKKTGKVINTGISVYETKEATAGIANDYVDYLQIPFSILDQRMKNEGVLEQKKNLTIAARSVFTQGLLFLEDCRIPVPLYGIKTYLTRLRNISHQWGYTLYELAVGYVKAQSSIDYLIFGVDNPKQIRDMVCAFENTNLPLQLLNELDLYFALIDKKTGGWFP